MKHGFISIETKEKLKHSSAYNIIVYYRKFKKEVERVFYPLKLVCVHVDKTRPRKISISKNLYFDNTKIIVSLTSFPDRITLVQKTICSIMNQSLKANMIILWLSEKQFPNKEGDLPKALLNLVPIGLTIKWLKDDTKSYKKLVPCLLEFPKDIIITADDDLYYPKNWISRLIQSYKENPKVIHCHLTTQVYEANGNFVFMDRYGRCGDGNEGFSNKILGGSGTLYPPDSLYKDVTNQTLFMELAPTNDDIWFWAMAILQGSKIRWIKNGMKTLYYIEGSQEETPCLVNINNHGDNLKQIQTKEVFNRYNIVNIIDKRL